jgi:hypothetical protein
MRRDPEIEEDAIDTIGESVSGQHTAELSVVRLHDDEPRLIGRLADSIRVAVEADNTNAWIATKEVTRVPSPAEGSVQDPPRRRRLEPCSDLVDHDRFVVRGGNVAALDNGQSPGALAPTWKRAE